MNKKNYHKPLVLAVDRTKKIESIQLAGVSPCPVIFIKSKLVKRK